MNLSPITAILSERLGIDPDALGMSAVATAVTRRMKANDIEDVTVYAARLASDEDEFQVLTEEVSVPETWFFRGGIELFRHLAVLIRDAVGSQLSRVPFRVLSAPCGSGEEPYSLAIALAEAGVQSADVRIDGIDISRTSLQKARAGRYRRFSFRQTDAILREHYFSPVDGGWEIVPTIRTQVQVRRGNLLDPAALIGERAYDLIFCRNLLIYLHAAARARVLDNLTRLLAPNGRLCTGHAEPIQLQHQGFESIQPERFMLFRRVQLGQECAPQTKTAALKSMPVPIPIAERERDVLPTHPADQEDLARARQLADSGQIDSAVHACTAHLGRAGPSAAAYSLLGILRQARREEDEAMRCFRKALYLQPNHEEALTHLMILCRQQGDAIGEAGLRRRLEQVHRGGEK
jgi:chemotaxis protein methyltransferase WspC